MQAFKVDLTNCDREPIHIPGHIQPHGFLVALDPETLTIQKLSANIAEYFAAEPGALIGLPLQTLEDFIVPSKPGSNISELIRLGKITGNFEQLNPQHVIVGGHPMFMIIHQHKNQIICEFEAWQTTDENISMQRIMSTALAVIQSATSFDELLHHVSKLVKDITGYDRIMIYKFHKDQHGEVIAEAKEAHLETWLHLHYPASDIPAQARELYKLNLVRIIADVNSQPAGLLSHPDHDSPLDLTHSTLRAVSPIHIEYLKNMEVGASFSISLVSRGELWGLIACHHYRPRFIDYNSRMACKFIGQLFSAALEFKHSEDNERTNLVFREKQQQLLEQTMKEMDLVEGLINREVNLLSMNSATGVAFCYEGKLYTLGIVPDEAHIEQIVNWLKSQEFNSFFQTSELPYQHAPSREIAGIASGIMAIEISHNMGEFIIWFKPEIIRAIDWAGNQAKDTQTAEDGTIRLSPRKSFEKYTQEVKNTSAEWTDNEIGAAIKLREDLIQVINKKSGEIRKLNELLKAAYDELDTFSFTVSHDLRTPLSSIKNYTEIILEDHGDKMDEDARHLFNKVIAGVDKMAGLIKNILQYSRVGRSELNNKITVDMKAMLHEIKEELLGARKGEAINFEIGNTPELYGDKTMLLQLFTNLLGNGVKYSTYPGNNSRVKVSGEKKAGFVTYTVEDNGIGLDMKYAGRIFELFQRLDNVKNIEGTGVGLAIAKRIVEKHGGKIWLESQLNSGTKFFIALPDKEQ